MAFFRQELAIDLGTANTVIFKDGQVILDEPGIIACAPMKQSGAVRGTCLSLKSTYPFLEH